MPGEGGVPDFFGCLNVARMKSAVRSCAELLRRDPAESLLLRFIEIGETRTFGAAKRSPFLIAHAPPGRPAFLTKLRPAGLIQRKIAFGRCGLDLAGLGEAKVRFKKIRSDKLHERVFFACACAEKLRADLWLHGARVLRGPTAPAAQRKDKHR